jgi:4-hydroxybenzoate polyprenyltransferase
MLLARLDRPIGVWLLFLPCAWSLALAAQNGAPNYKNLVPLLLLFFIGAIVMRAAGCVINDLWDKDLDKHVIRTQSRPLASGSLSTHKALLFLAGLLLCGLFILVQLPKTAIILGFVVLPLIISYPVMKRITWWPQAFLGLTFNFGALIGWAAIHNDLNLAAITLYIMGIFWTLGYDTIYALQDKDDDMMIGIKSTALKFGDHAKHWCAWFYVMMMVMLFATLLISDKGLASLAACGIPASHLIWQLRTLDIKAPETALAVFKANTITGFLILIPLVL